jgi:hypothetical protein
MVWLCFMTMPGCTWLDTLDTLQHFRWEKLDLPPNGLGLATTDIHLFPALKEQL